MNMYHKQIDTFSNINIKYMSKTMNRVFISVS